MSTFSAYYFGNKEDHTNSNCKREASLPDEGCPVLTLLVSV
jgi:hypothetical protein